MQVNLTYEAMFYVTRQVEIDEDDLQFYKDHYPFLTEEEVFYRWMNVDADTEFHADVLKDWRTAEPLPEDFELQYCSVNFIEVIDSE